MGNKEDFLPRNKKALDHPSYLGCISDVFDFLDDMEIGMLEIDMEGCIRRLNLAAASILGISMEEALNKIVWNSPWLYYAENSYPLNNDENPVVLGGANCLPDNDIFKIFNVVTRITKRVRVKVKKMSESISGAFVQIEEISEYVHTDLSDSKIKDEKIAKSGNETGTTLQNAIPDLLFRVDKSGKYFNLVTSGEETSNSSEDKFSGEGIEKILPLNVRPLILQKVKKAVHSGKVEKFETAIEIENSKRQVESRIIAISASDALVIFRDITEQKELEYAYVNTSQQLCTLIEHIHSGIFFMDETYRVIHINKRCCEMFDIPDSAENLIGIPGKKIIDIICEALLEESDEVARFKEGKFPEQKIIGVEVRLKNGKIYEGNYIPVSDNKVAKGHLFQYRDITEKKRNDKYIFLQHELGYKLAAISSMDEALELIKSIFLKIDDDIDFGIYLIDPATNVLQLRASSNYSNDFGGFEGQYKSGTQIYETVQQGDIAFKQCDDLMGNLEIPNFSKGRYWGIVPIHTGTQIIGTVIIGCSDNSPDERLKKFLKTVIAQLGGGIHRIYAQNRLILSQRNLNLMFQSIDDIILIFKRDGGIINSNKAAEKYLGYTVGELKNFSVLSIYPHEFREEFTYILEKVYAENSYSCSFPLISKEGRLVPVETRLITGRWYDEEVFYAISRDMSEKKRANKRLREVEEHWQFTLESTGVGIWDWNIQSGEIYYSKHWKQMLGYKDKEISNTLFEWRSRIHSEDKEKTINDIESHIKGETPIFINEYRLLCKNGEYKWILGRGKVVSWDDDGFPLRMIGTQTDITKSKDLEKSLVSALQKEKELGEMKSRFVSMTSHEFRTPLATMLVTTDTLENYWGRMSGEDINKKLKRIRENIQFLKVIVDNTLNLSRSESGNTLFNPEETNVLSFIQQLVNDIKRSVGVKHNIVLQEPETSFILNIDKRMMSQVFTNLLVNSIKYSDEGTTIKIFFTKSNKNLKIHISDQGIGIPEVDKENIFDAFKRGANVQNIHGTGLGLALAKQFVQKHGGTITFHSKVNSGTTFIVEMVL